MINNVLEEIKKLRIQRTNAQTDLKKLYVNPTHFNMNKDIKAHRTVNNINDLYGTSENERQYINVGESNYKNTLFTGNKPKDFDQTVKTAYKDGIYKSDYFNKFYGIPKNLKILNSENTLYYEKKLGSKNEWDYATNNFDGGDVEKLTNFKTIIDKLKDKKGMGGAKELIAGTKNKKVQEYVKKHYTSKPPISTVSPVLVSPAFSSPLPDDPVVGPALTKGESGLQNLAKKLKSATIIKETMKRRYDMKRYDKAKTATATATAEPAVVTSRSQSEKSTTTPRTPLTKKGKK